MSGGGRPIAGRLVLLAVVASAFLGACAGDGIGDSAATRPLGADFGNAVRHNEAAHVVDPNPVAAGTQAPALDGMRAAAAISRYRTNTVRELEIERTADRQDE